MISFALPENHPEYEYDVRGLLTSFFPGEEVKQSLSGEGSCYHLIVPAFDEMGDAAAAKHEMKRLVYRTLCRDTGKTLPWGSLTGIRPAKLVLNLLEKGADEETVRRVMKEKYLIGPEKLDLALSIARTEAEVLRTIPAGGTSLYVGIPFCPTRCVYCSFTAYPIGPWKDRVGDYLEALFREMRGTARLIPGKRPTTVYIGGGTPTALEPEELDRLLTVLRETFDLSACREFTVEAGRPDSITPDKLQIMKDHGVDRISVNPQSMNEETLRRIGRLHSVESVREAFRTARRLGFDNINMDMILGLPGEGPAEVRTTLRELEALAPDSLTVHSLAVKRTSRLKMEAEGPVRSTVSQAEAEEMMRLSAEAAGRMGLRPYYLYRQKNMAGNLENVGFAAPGREGLYNILMMEEKQSILALGAGTVSKVLHEDGRIERCDNVKEIPDYIRRLDEMMERKYTLWL